MTRAELIEQEADRMATRSYLASGRFGGVSKAANGVIVSKKYFDFAAIKNKCIAELTAMGFGTKKVKGK